MNERVDREEQAPAPYERITILSPSPADKKDNGCTLDKQHARMYDTRYHVQ